MGKYRLHKALFSAGWAPEARVVALEHVEEALITQPDATRLETRHSAINAIATLDATLTRLMRDLGKDLIYRAVERGWNFVSSSRSRRRIILRERLQNR